MEDKKNTIICNSCKCKVNKNEIKIHTTCIK